MDELEKLRSQLTAGQRQRQADLEEMWGADNAVLILTQLPAARFCLTWSGWRAVGRTVLHGERGARIVLTDGTVATVFDLYQTTGLPHVNGGS